MENIGDLERETIISVLSQGKELANELKRKLHPTTSSREACDYLLANIVSSYENAIKLLDHCMENGDPSQMGACNVFDQLPVSVQGSPISEGLSDPTNSADHQLHKPKKRKTLAKWSEQVRVRSERGFEGQIDDGYNWRKYGQKDILGANHPRAYYRCTHRNTQGCLATKQVQRADDDPFVLDVSYRGKHSCVQERLKQTRENINLVLRKKEEGDQESPMHSHEITTSTAEPHVKAENRESVTSKDSFPSFSFRSTPIESENVEARFFSENIDFIGANYSPQFISPATSESYFSMSVNDFSNDFAEIISNPSPFRNFSFGDFDLSIDQMDFSSQLLDAIDYF